MKEELQWNAKGLLQPISAPTAMRRAPYAVTLAELADRFGTTSRRRSILRGFLAYRAALRAIGIAQGFHWIDGSFVEDIETLEQRPPGDIDVVTFYVIPDGETQQTLFDKNPLLFPSNDEEKEKLKAAFQVDGSMSSLSAKPRPLIKQIVFWYSLWSHRRDHTWKGFLQLDLDGKDDSKIEAMLMSQDESMENGDAD